jgi:phosphatidylserine decarboxylase
VLRTLHVPGKLFSVAPFTVDAVPRLFARNERLVCHLECAHGPMVVAMVGAMLVSGVETVWGGVEIPPYARAPVAKDVGHPVEHVAPHECPVDQHP